MSEPVTQDFPSEAEWPFLLRQDALRDAQDFLEDSGIDSPIHLQISGDSGVGKSFFVKELVCRFAASLQDGVAIYFDVPQPELEAGEVLKCVSAAMSSAQFARRGSPVFVSGKIQASWRARRMPKSNARRDELYARLRDIVGALPEPAKYVKALMPTKLSEVPQIGAEPVQALRFLVEQSAHQTILIAIDNVQFLPTSLRESIAQELLATGKHFRLITVERTVAGRLAPWSPAAAHFFARPLRFGPADKDDLSALVRRVMPDSEDFAEVVDSVYRCSAGNLKSAWYQLRLIAERRTQMGTHGPLRSYQDVIDTLPPADQLVLRFVVFMLGRITVNNLAEVCGAANLGVQGSDVFAAVEDLSKLGLVIVNGENKDRVRPEHEMVSTLVMDLTPEEEQSELRLQLVEALNQVLKRPGYSGQDESLYDRLIGLIHEGDVRSSAALQSHLVGFVYKLQQRERFGYLADLLENTVYRNVLDLMPSDTVRILLDSLQKTSRFHLGLVIAMRLQGVATLSRLGALYSAKYLVQLFRYDEAESELVKAGSGQEAASVAFNISLNLCRDTAAACVAEETYLGLAGSFDRPEYALVILRNSGHLFPAGRSREILDFALKAFHRQGKLLGTATCMNNLGIVELGAGNLLEARAHLTLAFQILQDLDSPEAYQPLVNLCALECSAGQYDAALHRLREARLRTPSTLSMDLAMLDFNQSVLELLRGESTAEQSLPHLLEVLGNAARTNDLRFIEVLTRFVGELQERCLGHRLVPAPEPGFNEILGGAHSPLELYFPLRLHDGTIQVPLVLSPHWRY